MYLETNPGRLTGEGTSHAVFATTQSSGQAVPSAGSGQSATASPKAARNTTCGRLQSSLGQRRPFLFCLRTSGQTNAAASTKSGSLF
jgi:hypothetical protein